MRPLGTEAEHAALIREAILRAPAFLGATFSGRMRGQMPPWTRVQIRPVLINGQQLLQIACHTESQVLTQNCTGGDAAERIDELLTSGFKNLTVRSAAETLEITITKSGKSLLRRSAPSPTARTQHMSHDRLKAYPIHPDNSSALLDALGMMTAEGAIRAESQRKFRQINEFIKLIEQSGCIEQLRADPIQIVDFGCGNAYLTFAVFHYFQNILRRPVQVLGIDRDEAAVQRNNERAAALGWERIAFEAGSIQQLELPQPPDVALALHACDTATDEALARAIAARCTLIVAVPCCHHDLQEQLDGNAVPHPWGPVLRQSILKERLGDILTDALRAQVLRILGYKVDVLQFISPEHTAKNLMIRAVRQGRQDSQRLLKEYEELKAVWGVTPCLEQLLAEHSVALSA